MEFIHIQKILPQICFMAYISKWWQPWSPSCVATLTLMVVPKITNCSYNLYCARLPYIRHFVTVAWGPCIRSAPFLKPFILNLWIKDLIGKTTSVKKYTFRGLRDWRQPNSTTLSDSTRAVRNHVKKTFENKAVLKKQPISDRRRKVDFPGTTCSAFTISRTVLSWLWCDHSLTYKKHSISLRVNSFK